MALQYYETDTVDYATDKGMTVADLKELLERMETTAQKDGYSIQDYKINIVTLSNYTAHEICRVENEGVPTLVNNKDLEYSDTKIIDIYIDDTSKDDNKD